MSEKIINGAPRQATMTIAYEKGEQVITHPTGVVTKVTVKDLEDRKKHLVANKARIEEQLAAIDKDIAECGKSAVEPVEK
jgi:ArsR family metal-binding transcriptional regulator